MKRLLNHILLLSLIFTLSSCGIYNSYVPTNELTDSKLYGDIELSAESSNLGLLHWKDLLTDNKLQELIERGLENNADLKIAHLRIEQAEATLTASKLAFLPSLALSPQGGIGSFGGNSTGETYALPITASWQVDIFGNLRNAKKRSKVLVERSRAYEQAIRVQLISTIAQQYYTLSMLREQEVVINETVALWQETLRVMRALMKAGRYNDADVAQAEASYNGILASQLEIGQQIHEVENLLSVIIGESIRDIATNPLHTWQQPQAIHIGVPLQLLSHRPDVQMAELNLAAAFYTTNEARSAFYPALTLSGSLGWTNVTGVITNPGKLLIDGLASLTQPLFTKGRLTAQLRIAKSQQEEAKINFGQTLLNAGMEVNNAYTQVLNYEERTNYLNTQVASLSRATEANRLLMEGGSASYLEVLTAQNQLLNAEFALLVNRYNEIASFITLYQALGGGRNF